MTSFSHGVQTSPVESDVKKVMLFVVVMGVLFSSIYFSVTLLSAPSDQPRPSENYIVRTLVLYQAFDYVQNDVTYEFKYIPGDQTNLLQVTSKGQTVNYPAIPGITYSPFDLKITIHSSTENMLTLHITSVTS